MTLSVIAVPALAALVLAAAVWIARLRGLLGQRTRELQSGKEALAASENRFRTIIDAEPECVKLVGLDCRLIEMNPAGLAMIEVEDLEQVRGQDLRRVIISPEHRVAYDQLSKKVFEGQSGKLVFEIEGMRGTRRWLESHAVPLKDSHGAVTALLAVTRDITRARQAQEALTASEKQYRDLVETSDDLIWSVDIAGRWTFVNRKAAMGIFGYEPAEMLGRPFYDFMTPERARKDLQTFAQVKSGEPRFHYETEMIRKDGMPVALSFNAIVLLDAKGGMAGATGTATDITARKRLEEQFRQSQKMEAIGKLAGGVAHDFNNLLTAIFGHCDVLLGGAELPAGARDGLHEIRGAAQRAASLTQQLLAFSRKQVLSPRVLDLNVVVGNLEKMLRRLIGEHIELVTTLGPDLWRVKADPGQIEQVLLNLAVNSRDAMSQGGRLTIDTSNVTVGSGGRGAPYDLPAGRYALLTVRDTGCGIDDSVKARVFEPFFTTKQLGQGTGLGLATVYGIVKQSNGHILLASEPDRGTEFTIYLPRCEEDALVRDSVEKVSPPRGGGELVLVVEDEASVRSLVSQVLRGQGYAVVEAQDGRAALATCAELTDPLQLVITDIIMPVMGGRELLQSISSIYPEARIILMSGYTDDLLLQRDVLTSGARFLQKPFSPGELLSAVREALTDGEKVRVERATGADAS